MIDEHVQQSAESLKALLKASLNEEAVTRIREDQKLLDLLGKRVDIVEKYVGERVGETEGRLVMRMDGHRAEWVENRDKVDNRVGMLEERTGKVGERVGRVETLVGEQLEELNKNSEEFREKKRREEEVRKLVNDMVNNIA